MVVPQSHDIFGESFLLEDLSNLSCMNSKNSKLRNSRSCPTTPNFDVCSEKLLVNSDISDFDSISIADVPLHQDTKTKCMDNSPAPLTKNEKKFSEELIHVSETSDNLFISDISQSLSETKNYDHNLYQSSSQKPKDNENIFKTPLSDNSHRKSSFDSMLHSQHKDKIGNIPISGSSFAFSDSDTDGYLEKTPSASVNYSERKEEKW